MRNLQLSLRELERSQRQMSSGRVISQPSDNPVVAAKLLNISSAMAESEQFQANVRDGLAWLSVTDTNLGHAGEALHRVKELALAGANAAMPDDAKVYMAREVDQLLRHVVALANVSFDGNRSLFGGTHHGAAPFTVTEGTDGFLASVGVSSAGAGEGTVSYEIIRQIDIQVNTEGARLFVDGGIFDALLAVRDALRGTGDIQLAIAGMDDALNTVLNERAVVGARHNRLLVTEQRYQEEAVTFAELRSKLGDIDMAEAIMNFNVREHVYQAALAAAARVLQPTLLDFLR
jgi:flagellar hook-associated protein 3 FlgL